MALVAIGLLMTTLKLIPQIRTIIASRVLALGSGFGNTGYFGIPVSIALLPSSALSYSIGFDLGATLAIWALGPLLLSKDSIQLEGRKKWNYFLYALARSPASKGLIGAMIIHITPWNDVLTSTLWVPSKIIIVLALVIVGMNIGSVSYTHLTLPTILLV